MGLGTRIEHGSAMRGQAPEHRVGAVARAGRERDCVAVGADGGWPSTTSGAASRQLPRRARRARLRPTLADRRAVVRPDTRVLARTEHEPLHTARLAAARLP